MIPKVPENVMSEKYAVFLSGIPFRENGGEEGGGERNWVVSFPNGKKFEWKWRDDTLM